MEAPIKKYLPIISSRIDFGLNSFIKPPTISARIDFANRLRTGDTPVTSSESILPLPPTEEPIKEAPGAEMDIDRLSDFSDLSDISDDEGGPGVPDEPKIKKPPGEVGRPHSGGYNLQNVLSWDDKLYKQVVEAVHKQAKSKLDLEQTYQKQNVRQVHKICEQIRKNFPIIEGYENDWPVRDMLKMHLKYKRSAKRTADDKAATDNLEKAVKQKVARGRQVSVATEKSE